jgi:MYXO-CTERM domain-containing protein
MIRLLWVALAVVFATGPAFAEDTALTFQGRPAQARGDERVAVPVAPDEFADADSLISPYIYVNRCVGCPGPSCGCNIMTSNIDDARANQSHIPMSGGMCSTYPICTLSEFLSVDGKKGNNGKCRGGTAANADCTDANSATVCTGGGDCYSADDEWNEVLKCMREVYSPYGVTISDQKPSGGLSYTMAILAGKAAEIGWSGALGVAPVASDCSPKDNVISFSFANDHQRTNRVFNMCWTVAQETAHAFGLDHSYQFSDGTSACNDPMTYRYDCGGQKFFRNKPAQCGESMVRPCSCGGSQNSHQKIFNTFGAGQSLIPAPTVTVTSPVPNAKINNGAVVSVQAGSKRGVEKVELFLNGWLWATAPGAKFGGNGQPNPSTYGLTLPANVPDGIIDIVVVASDDIDVATTAPTITVTKGVPCADASTCAKGQKCEQGKCFWDPPVGELGDECGYPEYCVSNVCVDTTAGSLCSQECIVGAADGCPMNFACDASGVCVPDAEDPGCCSVGGGPKQVWFHLAISALILGFVVRRRRRR